MIPLRSIVKNTLARSATEMITRLSSLAYWIFIGNYLGIRGIGIYAFANAIFQFLLTSSGMGLGTWVTREIARDRQSAARYWGNLLILGSGVAILGNMITWVSALLLAPGPLALRATILMGIALIPANGIYWARSILFAFEKMEYVAFARLVENCLRIGLGLWVLHRGYDIDTTMITFIISKVAGFVFMAARVTKLTGRPEFRLQQPLITSLISELPTFGTVAVVNSLFWSISLVLLTNVCGHTATGLFSTGMKLLDIFMSFALAFGQAVFPVLARLALTATDRIEKLCQQSLKYLLILAAGVVIITWYFADTIILLFGKQMAAAAGILRILIWALVPFSGIPVLAFTLISNNQQKLDLRANLIALGILAISTSILSSIAGAKGAAIGLNLAISCFFYLELRYVKQYLFPIKLGTNIWKIPVSALVAVFFAEGVVHGNAAIALTVMVILYVFALFWLKVILPEELRPVVHVLINFLSLKRKVKNDLNSRPTFNFCSHPDS